MMMYRNFDVEIKKRRIEGGDLCKDKKRYTLYGYTYTND